MTEAKKVLTGIAYVIGGLLAVALIIWAGTYAIKHLPSSLAEIGATQTQTSITDAGFLGKAAQIILGATLPITYEQLILLLAIFIIMLFALAEILEVMSLFSSATAWVIAFGLAIIAGVTKIVAYIAGVFAITSGIGAIGIAIIIIMAIVSAVIMSFIIGKAGIKNALDAKNDQDKVNQAARKMRKGYGLLKAGSEIVDEEA
jgi:hypothetical protein